ncbi:MAG: hypothetical protein P4N59_07705 [Negativicutes bacterium]|nr:hypothetical protein [Negativicutes bacterium]
MAVEFCYMLGIFFFVFIPALITVGVFSYRYGRLAATCSRQQAEQNRPVRVMTREDSGETEKPVTNKITKQEFLGPGRVKIWVEGKSEEAPPPQG